MRRSIQFSLSTRHIVHSAINIAARRRSLKKKENKKIQTSSSFFFLPTPLFHPGAFFICRDFRIYSFLFVCICCRYWTKGNRWRFLSSSFWAPPNDNRVPRPITQKKKKISRFSKLSTVLPLLASMGPCFRDVFVDTHSPPNGRKKVKCIQVKWSSFEKKKRWGEMTLTQATDIL